jgi:hypothetical protein
MTSDSAALLIGLVGATAGIIGGAVGAIIQGSLGLKQRRLDIFLTNRANAYGFLFRDVMELNANPHDACRYAFYRARFDVAKMFCSEQGQQILEEEKRPSADSLDYAVQRLRRTSVDKLDFVRTDEFYDAVKQLSDACRHDLQDLTKLRWHRR